MVKSNDKKGADDELGFADADVVGDDELVEVEPLEDATQVSAPSIATTQAAVEADTHAAKKRAASAETVIRAVPAEIAARAKKRLDDESSVSVPGAFPLDSDEAPTKAHLIPNLSRASTSAPGEPPQIKEVAAAPLKEVAAPELGRELEQHIDLFPTPSSKRQPQRAARAPEVGEAASEKSEQRATQAVVARAARSERKPRSPIQRVISTVVLAVLVLALVLGVLAFLNGGELDRKLLTLDAGALATLRERATFSGARPEVVYEGLRVVGMRSVLYPASASQNALVFFGEVKNEGEITHRDVEITASLTDARGELVGVAKSPLGITLSPKELVGLTTSEAVGAALRRKATATPGDVTLRPGAVASYVAVLVNPPAELSSLTHEVRLASGPTYVDPPPPAPAPAPVAPAPVVEAPAKRSKTKTKRPGSRR